MMGMNWAYAMSQGAAAAAGAGADMIDRQMKEDAEARAADRKLQDAERLMAIQEAMKNRAAERFASVARTKAGEEVPTEAPSVAQTGLTSGSAQSVGLKDGIQGDASVVQDIVKRAQETLKNPSATDEQKMHAKGIIEQISSQAEAQGTLNAKSVEGKTRKRSWSEAIQAAREETSLNDPGAFMAGEAMFGADRKADLEEKKLQSREKLEKEKLEENKREATFRDAQQERRHQETMERLERQGKQASDTQNKQLQQQFAIAIRSQISDIDRDIRELEKSKKSAQYDDAAMKEINDTIAEKKDARKQIVEMQMDYFKDSGIKVPAPREPKTDELKPGNAAGSKNDPLGIRKK